MTRSEAIKLVTLLKAAFPRQEMREETLAVYVDALADLDADLAARAVKACVGDLKFLPSIAEIRERACPSSGLPSGAEAWEEVPRMISRYGWSQPRFENPASQAATDAIGWQTIGMSECIGVERGHWIRAYESAKERILREERHGRYVPALPGVSGGHPPRLPPSTRTGQLSAGAALGLLATSMQSPADPATPEEKAALVEKLQGIGRERAGDADL